MDSFGIMKRVARDFHQVYVRRRRRVVRDQDLNIPFGSESSMLETDVSLEIGDDGVSLVLLFQFLPNNFFGMHFLSAAS
jgi:hypothetical protein